MSSHLSREQRLMLIEEVYQTFLDGTETFEDGIGIGLSYLMGEIARDGYFDDLPDSVYYDEFLSKMEDLFPKEHAVWLFVVKEGELRG